MPEENIAVTPAETPTPTPAPRRRRTTPAQENTPQRTVEELASVNPTRMTDEEKNQYILYCRTIINQKTAQLANLDETARKVFERGANAERAYSDLKAQVDRDMQLIRASATIFAESIINHTFGGK